MIFDTDVLIWFFRGDPRAAELIESCAERAVSVVSLLELYQGARSRNEMRVLARFFPHQQFRMLPVTESISHSAVTLMEEHALGHGLQTADALIAATARETGSVLATGNVRHFRVIRRLEIKAFRPSGV